MEKNDDIADIKKNFLNLEKYIDIVLNNDFYNNKMNLSKVNEIIIKWNNSLTSILPAKVIMKIILKYCSIILVFLKDIGKMKWRKITMKKDIEKQTTYENIKECFFYIIGYINMILQYQSYNESFDEYRNILLIVTKWMINYEESRDISLINHVELLEIYKKLDNLQTKYTCNVNMGKESELSDYVLNWMWDLMYLRKSYIENRGNGNV